MQQSRRTFLQNTSKMAALSAIPAILKNRSPNDVIQLGLIGARGQGMADMHQALKQPDVKCVAIADIDDNVIAERSSDIEKIQGSKPTSYKDFRKLLADQNIDAVIIGTPDHWHCYQLIASLQAGKDVYVEKPLANSVGECNLMVSAVRKYKKIVQVGQQQRSGDHWQQIMQLIKEGRIGSHRKTMVWANFRYGVGQPAVPDSPVPQGVDFDMWLGPAPERSFNKARFHGSWRMFWDYGGGLMTDWGVHLMDMALWARDIKELPQAVNTSGGVFAFPKNAHETFDTMTAGYQMTDHDITYMHTAGIQSGPWNRPYGLAFIGNDGTIVVNRESWELIPEIENGKAKTEAIPLQTTTDSHEVHVKNWIDCLRDRREPACPIETGRLAAVYTHLANISLRTRTRIEWQPATENFGNNAEANKLIMPAYREKWKLSL